MPSIQITSVNYNDQVASITFYSSTDPATPVSLGSHTMPYVRTDNDVYGTYELNFTAYSKICSVSLSAPTTTTTTTTAAPISSYTISNAGSAVNGCYTQAGTYNGKPYYTNEENGYFIWYEGFEFSWYMSNSLGGGPPEYVGSDENNVPTSWSEVIGAPPAPTASSGCSAPTTTTTTTTAAPTTTTTTTAAPSAVGYLVSGAGDASANGTYCEAGTINGRPYYTYSSLYLYWYPSMSQEQGRWHIGTVNGSEEGGILYATRDDGDENIMPDDIFTNWYNSSDSWWGFETGASPSPTVTQTTCGGATTTTTTAPTTTTTTTPAPQALTFSALEVGCTPRWQLGDIPVNTTSLRLTCSGSHRGGTFSNVVFIMPINTNSGTNAHKITGPTDNNYNLTIEHYGASLPVGSHPAASVPGYFRTITRSSTLSYNFDHTLTANIEALDASNNVIGIINNTSWIKDDCDD